MESVEDNVGVGEIVDEIDLMLPAKIDDALEECEVDTLRSGICREIEDQHFGARIHQGDGFFEFGQKAVGVVDGNAANVCAGDHRAVDVDRVAGVGHQNDVALIEGRKAEVRDALLDPMVTMASVSGSSWML